MAELRRFLLWAALAVLAGIALHHLIGTRADAVAGVAIVNLAQLSWRRHRLDQADFRRAVIELRSEGAENRARLLDDIESTELRDALRAATAAEGSETRDGVTESFPFPRSFQRRASRKYWQRWLASGIALAVAAFLPDLDPTWRVLWLVAGIALLLRARNRSRLYDILDSRIELNPYRLSQVLRDGSRRNLNLKASIEAQDFPDSRMLTLQEGETVVYLSYHLIGFERLLTLLHEYGVLQDDDDAVAS